jgi:deoxyadenosine/deoxycytidine kinase
MENVSKDNTLTSEELFNNLYKVFEEYFSNFEKYVNNITVTKTLDGLNNEEVMISAPKIIAVHEKYFNKVMQKLWALKKEP